MKVPSEILRQPSTLLHDVLTSVTGASASPSEQREPQKKALLIGANYTRDFYLRDLKNSHDDVQKVFKLLTSECHIL